jgi:hypothetical protein
MRALSTRAYPVNLLGAAAVAAGVVVALALLILAIPGIRQQDATQVSGIVPQAATKSMSFLEANTFLPQVNQPATEALPVETMRFMESNSFLPPVSQPVAEAVPVETIRFIESNTFLPAIGESAGIAGESEQEAVFDPQRMQVPGVEHLLPDG